MMGVLFDAASGAGVSIDFVTAGEVYDEFTLPRPKPAGGFALTVPVGLAAYAAAQPVLGEGGAPLDHVREVNSAAAILVLELLESERPAIGYYAARARQQEVLAPYEVHVARALLHEPCFDTIIEVGAGVAALPICLALNGARAVGMEKDASRARIAQSLLDRLAAAQSRRGRGVSDFAS
jgi:hypothetical protein